MEEEYDLENGFSYESGARRFCQKVCCLIGGVVFPSPVFVCKDDHGGDGGSKQWL